MITLSRKKTNESNGKRISIRWVNDKIIQMSRQLTMSLIDFSDRLLVKEVQEMEENLPSTVKTNFPDSNNLAEFSLTVQPNEGENNSKDYNNGQLKSIVSPLTSATRVF